MADVAKLAKELMGLTILEAKELNGHSGRKRHQSRSCCLRLLAQLLVAAMLLKRKQNLM